MPFLPRAVSVASVESFDTVRQAPSTPAASAHLKDDQRWSEIVPPESGLTFAMVEKDDTLSFSAPALLSESTLLRRPRRSPDSPSDTDGRSQILTIGASLFSSPSEYTGTLQYFRENHDSLFPDSESRIPLSDRPIRSRTQTSSTMDGLDVYLRGSMLGKAHNANRYRSCFQDLEGEFAFDPRTSFANAWLEYMKHGIKSDDVSDEGFFESSGQFTTADDENNLSSAFSVTTTSTSNFVTVENEMNDAETVAWSNLEPPNTPGFSQGLMFPSAPTPAQPHRLRKPRPTGSASPASPAEVLHRPQYNYSFSAPAPTPVSSPQRSVTPSPRARVFSLPKLARSLTKGRGDKANPAGWVWVDFKDNPRSPAAAS